MAKLGSITVNEIEIIEVDQSPLISGVDASDGSIAILTDGTAFYLKIAGGPTLWQAVDKSFIGLSNVDNTSDINKPISTATQTALDTKSNLTGGNTISGVQTINGQVIINSTTSGFLLPRMTSTQRIAIVSPTEGLLVFDTDWNTVCEYSGAAWKFEARLNTTAIQTSTSGTYANITEFTSLSLDVGLYVLELKGIMQSTSTLNGVGLKLFNGTATISELNINWGFSQGGIGTDKDLEYSQLSTADNVTSASVATANANFPVYGNGTFRLSSAGTVSIQLRSETNGTGISIRPNSTVMFKKIG